MAMNDEQIRIVDPVLTTHARGYKNSSFVGSMLFPIVTSPYRGFKRIEFDRASFRKHNTRRAPGASFMRIDSGHKGLPVRLEQHALIAATPGEHQDEGAMQPGLNIQARRVTTVQDVIALSLECAQADQARKAANYGADNKLAMVGAQRWDDPASDPLVIFNDASERIRSQIGRKPTAFFPSAAVAKSLRVHPKLLERFKHTTSLAITDEMLASYFDIPKVYVGGGIYDDDTGAHDIWGNDAILAYVPMSESADAEVPAFGYTYQLNNHPMVGAMRWNDDFDTWDSKVKDEWSPELVGPDAGFLFQNAVS